MTKTYTEQRPYRKWVAAMFPGMAELLECVNEVRRRVPWMGQQPQNGS